MLKENVRKCIDGKKHSWKTSWYCDKCGLCLITRIKYEKAKGEDE